MQVVPSEPRRRCRGDAGAAVVEAALVSPLFIYLLFSMIEMGLYFRDYLTIGATSTDAARLGAILGDQADSDFQVIQTVMRTSAPIPRASIKKLVIFRATSGSTSSVPTTCKNATTSFQDTTSECDT